MYEGAVVPSLPAWVPTGTGYRSEANGIAVEVDAKVGGRITEFSIFGRNVLLPRTVHPDHFGSTLWTSPQSAWHWPPPAEIDRNAYRASIVNGSLVLEGSPDALLGVAVSKRLQMTPAEGEQAPGEGEIEIYVNGNPAYIELEEQGPFTNLSPWAESRWSVEWVLSTLPRATALSADFRLVEHVRSVVKGRVEVEMQGPPSAERRVRERQGTNDE